MPPAPIAVRDRLVAIATPLAVTLISAIAGAAGATWLNARDLRRDLDQHRAETAANIEAARRDAARDLANAVAMARREHQAVEERRAANDADHTGQLRDLRGLVDGLRTDVAEIKTILRLMLPPGAPVPRRQADDGGGAEARVLEARVD
ncbi:hypothetical protein [Paracraurococcus ruber]|nr:hypothetical protein [Paracraurococcus ruber]TDG33945.1 hypothetical protein E2C05_01505 [Paracraurococcus ruber]